MPFAKGNNANPRGRPTGAIGALTKTIRERVLETVNTLQTLPGHTLLDFAKEHPKDFWPIAAKLIPTEIVATLDHTVIWHEETTVESEHEIIPETDNSPQITAGQQD